MFYTDKIIFFLIDLHEGLTKEETVKSFRTKDSEFFLFVDFLLFCRIRIGTGTNLNPNNLINF